MNDSIALAQRNGSASFVPPTEHEAKQIAAIDAMFDEAGYVNALAEKGLKQREREVFYRIALGHDRARIAREMHLSRGYIKTLRKRINAKLGWRRDEIYAAQRARIEETKRALGLLNTD